MDWNIVLSIITAAVAIAALFLTGHQIRLSNKQHLFDKRIENYHIIMGLLELYRTNRNYFDRSKNVDKLLVNDLNFVWLTNNTFLESISVAMKHPLEEQAQNILLIKLEELRKIALNTKFLFSGKGATLLFTFVWQYQELLFTMYQYQIVYMHVKKASEDHDLTLEKAKERVDEKQYRISLEDRIDALTRTYMELEKHGVEKEILRQIKLV